MGTVHDRADHCRFNTKPSVHEPVQMHAANRYKFEPHLSANAHSTCFHSLSTHHSRCSTTSFCSIVWPTIQPRHHSMSVSVSV
jgi:hypothetical protein